MAAQQPRQPAERSISIGRESLQVFLCTRRHGVLAGFTARGQSRRNMVWTGNKKAFCVLEFAKTESTVTVQWRFQTMYHTEPPMDKTIHEWYMKFQQSGCLCTAKRTGWPGLWPRLLSVCEKRLSGAHRSQHIALAGNCRCLSQVFGVFCANIFA